jgi:PAS domain S-box-containing protein
MLFGGNAGINILYPALIRQNNNNAPIRVSNFQILHETVPIRDKLIGNAINLNFLENTFSIILAALDYTFPERNEYRYKLEGFDTEWIDNGTNRNVTYTNLDPGSYTLRVQASNNDGVWNREGLSIPIKIHPPVWATWWAYFLYVFLIAFLFYQVMMINARKHGRITEERSNRRLALYVSSFNDTAEVILNADKRGTIVFSNDAARSVLGKTIIEINGHSMFELLFRNKEQQRAAQKSLGFFHRFQDEVDYEMPDGESRTLEVSIAGVNRPADQNISYVSLIRDVTERHAKMLALKERADELKNELARMSSDLNKAFETSQEQKETLQKEISDRDLLLKDIHDRVNDNLQMLISLLSIHASRIGGREATKLFEGSQQRIGAVALIHECMNQTGETGRVDMRVYCDMLCSLTYRRQAPRQVTVNIIRDVEPVYLNIDQAVPCGMALSELLTNALEHAFSDRAYGSGRVNLKLFASGDDCVVRVADDGSGIPQKSNPIGKDQLGLEIVSILVEQLNGQMRLLGGLGTTIEIRFPLSN